MAKILVFGTGNIGAVYACILARGGAQVTCVCRSNYDEVKDHGLKVTSTIFGELESRPETVRDPSDALVSSQQPFDYVLVCTKATSSATSTAIRLIKPAIVPGITAIMLIQNGLGVEEPYCAAFPGVDIISGVAYLPTTQISPGVFSHSEMEILHLGIYGSGHSPLAVARLDSFASMSRKGGATAILEDDIQVQRWRKIVANGAVSPICALSKCRDQQLMDLTPLAASLLRSTMLEIVAVAEAAGYGEVVGMDTVEKQMARCMSRPYPGVQPSMLADVLGSKPLEVDAIVGAIVRIGHEKRVEIPRLETLLVLLQGLDAAGSHQGKS